MVELAVSAKIFIIPFLTINDYLEASGYCCFMVLTKKANANKRCLRSIIMPHLEFFKKEAKNLFKDWQTQSITTGSDGKISYHYDSKFYDVDSLFQFFEWDDKDRQEQILARAQHLLAKIAGYKNWNELIYSSETEQELAELMLRHCKNSEALIDWVQTLEYTNIGEYGVEAVLDYAKQYFELGDRKEIVNLPTDKITILSGKLKLAEFNNFSAENNPEGILRKDSTVHCTVCNKDFNFSQSKVIRDNDKKQTLVVCKNYPSCKGTYLDYQVLTPTIMFGKIRLAALERGISEFRTDYTMDTKVHCIHCGKDFLYKEANVVQFPDKDEPLIYCKHFPNCDGSLLDMMPAEQQ